MFDVVLHEPEIPNNTGNIGRTCVATGCGLRLIEPIGFDLSERACRRAGLDYWPRLSVERHADFDDYTRATEQAEGRRWFLSSRGARLVYDADLRPGDHLVFGKESAGLPGAILDDHPERVLCLPLVPGERSLNLATAVCAVVYEGLRQCIERGDVRVDDHIRLATLNSPDRPVV
ncbi:MAG: tRNA (cytidine(34)-2'-O)-methyltransferase [Planctomycetota bacterium]